MVEVRAEESNSVWTQTLRITNPESKINAKTQITHWTWAELPVRQELPCWFINKENGVTRPAEHQRQVKFFFFFWNKRDVTCDYG